MKKPNTTTAMPRLYQACLDIVQGVRKANTSVGRSADAEMRIPVLFHGTDMRCTIEAGSGTAMRNAVEHAQMQSTDKPATEPGLDARLEAITLLGIYASEIKDRNTLAGRKTGWESPQDERYFSRVVSAMRALGVSESAVLG